MANTYTQLLIQVIFAVKGRQNLILEQNRIPIEKYICGIISNKNSKPLAIYCNPDHCHVLVGIDPNISVSKLTGEFKANSSRWINEQKMIPGKFEWQDGFGAFSYSKSQLDTVVKYILNQKERHRKITFQEEYLQLLEKFDIDFNEKYLFEYYD
jgi:REP element-mobilizing transposase RayT